MTSNSTDLILFLRMAGTKSGVKSTNIPSTLIAAAARWGGRVRFLGERVFVANAFATIRKLQQRAPSRMTLGHG